MMMTLSSDGIPSWIIFAISTMIAYCDPLDALEERRKDGLYQVCTIGHQPCLMLLIPLGSKAIDKLDGVITNGRLLTDMKSCHHHIKPAA